MFILREKNKSLLQMKSACIICFELHTPHLGYLINTLYITGLTAYLVIYVIYHRFNCIFGYIRYISKVPTLHVSDIDVISQTVIQS